MSLRRLFLSLFASLEVKESWDRVGFVSFGHVKQKREKRRSSGDKNARYSKMHGKRASCVGFQTPIKTFKKLITYFSKYILNQTLFCFIFFFSITFLVISFSRQTIKRTTWKHDMLIKLSFDLPAKLKGENCVLSKSCSLSRSDKCTYSILWNYLTSKWHPS